MFKNIEKSLKVLSKVILAVVGGLSGIMLIYFGYTMIMDYREAAMYGLIMELDFSGVVYSLLLLLGAFAVSFSLYGLGTLIEMKKSDKTVEK